VVARRLSVPWLLVILLVACLAPVVLAGTVDLAGADDVQLANSSGQRSTTTATDDTVSSSTTAAETEAGGGGSGETDEPAGDDDGESTTTTTEASTTTEAGETTTTRPPATTTTTAPEVDPAEAVLALVNDARAAAPTPCPPLTVDPHLQVAAQAHTDDMAARGYMDHVTPEGQDPAARAQAAGYAGSGVGENIAQGYPDAESVMAGWMASDGHKDNIENCSYTVIGIAYNTTGWYWTQVFGL
jgi:uncharacterized protein YkwD